MAPPIVNEISSSAIISALYRFQWPTQEQIAEYLRVEPEAVRKVLLEMRRKRVIVDRQRNKKRVWMPWNAT